METESKKTRTFLACDACRRSKLRCIEDEALPALHFQSLPGQARTKCRRCVKLNIECQYTPKRSQLKAKFNLPDNSNPIPDMDLFNNTIHNMNRKYRKKPHPLDSIILPNKEFLLEVINQFFQNKYYSTFNFIHKQSYIDWIRSDDFETQFFNYDDPNNIPPFTPCTLLAILALCSRDNDELSHIYGSFDQNIDPQRYIPDFQQTHTLSPEQSATNASRYFAYYSRCLLKDVFDTPSIQRVQSLTLLSAHEWSEANYSRSYLYIGIAARMGSILGLCSPRGICYKSGTPFITMESNRRTIWAVYMMDRCNSSGRVRNHAIKIEDIEVALPCPEINFQQNIEIEYPSYNKCFYAFDKLTSLDFTIITFELWSKVAKWVGDGGAKESTSNPMDSKSIFNQIYTDLGLLKKRLPAELQLENIDSQLSDGNLNFGYLHQLLFLCDIFLNREYFFYSANISKADHSMFTNRLINTLDASTKLNAELINKNKFCFTPFTLFQVFTNCVTCLSVSAILHNDALITLGLQNMSILDQNALKDQQVQNWFRICQQLKDYLSVMNASNLNMNSDKFKNLLNDFGESNIPERHNANQLQKPKKVDLHDILNSTTETPVDPTIRTSTLEQNFILQPDNNNKYIEIDKYFKNWEKIIPNWNDVFQEFDDTTLLEIL